MRGQVMSDPKPVASLGPLLLARKGTAKPAMRAQLGEHSRGTNVDDTEAGDDMREEEIASSQEDLGWNDMGEDAPEGIVVPLAEQEPEVRRQQSHLLNSIADSNLVAFRAAENQNDMGQKDTGDTGRRRKAIEAGRRAAFTLRLDQERHLKLKLASTVEGESAQQLVTRALDHFLSEMPEIETLAAQVRRDGKKV